MHTPTEKTQYIAWLSQSITVDFAFCLDCVLSNGETGTATMSIDYARGAYFFHKAKTCEAFVKRCNGAMPAVAKRIV